MNADLETCIQMRMPLLTHFNRLVGAMKVHVLAIVKWRQKNPMPDRAPKKKFGDFANVGNQFANIGSDLSLLSVRAHGDVDRLLDSIALVGDRWFSTVKVNAEVPFVGSGDFVHAQCAIASLQQAKREGFPIIGIPYLNGTYHTMFLCQDTVRWYTGTGR